MINNEKNIRKICEHDKCTGCGLCVQICPKSCICMEMNDEGFYYPVIDRNDCINCGLCERKCPVNSSLKKNNKSMFYMAWHKDDKVLEASSSGGVFTAISSYVFEQQGVVFGACFDEQSRIVYHTMIKNENELNKLRLSKYFQSNIGKTYKLVKQKIDEGKVVLFCGTACQIAGLYQYCGHSNSLITMDVLCHGVTSKYVVDAYIESKERKYKKKINMFWFRVKEGKDGWQAGGGTRMKLSFSDGTYCIQDKNEDTFFCGFNENIFLRESCYQCQYCGTERIADFTSADFWGITSMRANEEQRIKGISLLLVNSGKAHEILDELKKYLVINSIEPEEAIPYNKALVEPNVCHKGRGYFFKHIKKGESYDRIIKRILRKKYAKFFIKKMIILVVGEKGFSSIKMKLRKRRLKNGK